jgi:hypothetical protein
MYIGVIPKELDPRSPILGEMEKENETKLLVLTKDYRMGKRRARSGALSPLLNFNLSWYGEIVAL